VPMPFAASTTTSASARCSAPSRSTHTAPVASPRAFLVISRTRAPVTSFAPACSAAGQRVRSVEPLAPSGHPNMHVPRRAHCAWFSRACEGIAWAAGHQCQPRRFIPSAAFRPIFPIGSGGSGGARPGGYAGSPAMPETPTSASSRS
jgi:hypothetical protein